MNYTEQKLIAAVVSEGLRPVLVGSESGTPSGLLSLIKKCWDADPNNRPSFKEIVAELNLICDEMSSTEEVRSSVIEPTTSDQQSMEKSSDSLFGAEIVNWFTEGEEISSTILLNVASGMANGFDSPDNVSSYNPFVSCGSFATCGPRETMEDTHFLLPHMCGQRDSHLFGIFDGHRGE